MEFRTDAQNAFGKNRYRHLANDLDVIHMLTNNQTLLSIAIKSYSFLLCDWRYVVIQ